MTPYLIRAADLNMTAHFIDVTRMCHNPEYGPLLLTSMLVNIRYTNASENDQQLLCCRQMGKRALDLNCFSYIHDMIASSIFKDDPLVSRIVRKTVYNMLCCMCDYFDGDGSCCKYPYVYELLSELLARPSLAKDFCSTKEAEKLQEIFLNQARRPKIVIKNEDCLQELPIDMPQAHEISVDIKTEPPQTIMSVGAEPHLSKSLSSFDGLTEATNQELLTENVNKEINQSDECSRNDVILRLGNEEDAKRH
ncbi:hypothetical protein GQX74_010979 [Glossina fuscipes]|nr:hypothetical protein GQX74_010979 [Glossina fuscipes]